MTATTTSRAITIYSLTGFGLVLLLFVSVGGWAAWAPIQGAVIAPATVVVMGNTKKVQHVEGGIVSEIFVTDGQHVKAGELLLRLDETEIKANLAIVRTRLNEFKAQHARLEAERDNTEKIAFPDDMLRDDVRWEVKKLMAGQSNLFRARKQAISGKKEQLELRVTQLEQEVRGLEAQLFSKKEQSALISKELKALELLRKKDLVTENRLLALQREAARLKGEQGEHIAGIARARGKISETRLNIIQVEQDRQTEVLSELRQVQTQLAEYVERRTAAETKLRRTEIRAPKAGVVHQLKVHTIGGVISASEPVMLIVPGQARLELEARIEPQNIDQVKIGQKAVLRFQSFDARTTPELFGEVSNVSADLTRTNQDTPPFYTVRVILAKGEEKKLGKNRLKPGMPAEIFIQTGARTALNYLVKPLSDQLARAFRER